MSAKAKAATPEIEEEGKRQNIVIQDFVFIAAEMLKCFIP